MQITSRRKTIAFFIVLGVGLVALAVALNVGWIILNWREGVMLILGVILFAVLIAGLIVNTSFLVREVRRNEQHDSFINAVTHELKTPIASIRLYLETLQSRDVDDKRRREFYRLMLSDTDRLLGTVEQVLKAGQAGQRFLGPVAQVLRQSLQRAHVPERRKRREDVVGGRAVLQHFGPSLRRGRRGLLRRSL